MEEFLKGFIIFCIVATLVNENLFPKSRTLNKLLTSGVCFCLICFVINNVFTNSAIGLSSSYMPSSKRISFTEEPLEFLLVNGILFVVSVKWLFHIWRKSDT